MCLIACVAFSTTTRGQQSAPGSGFSVSPIIIVADQTPMEFLDLLGKTAKARWRLLFRPPPPTPPTDRSRSALILGTLIGESYLIWQAGDAQQFRNTNQDIVSYCRMLGVGDKLMPRLMTQGKMVEGAQWKELGQEITDGHHELRRLLRDMQDEDLALLIDTGMWLRMLEIASTLVADNPEGEACPLCVGTPSTLNDMSVRFGQISAKQREAPLLGRIQAMIDDTIKVWQGTENRVPGVEAVLKTRRSLEVLMSAIWEKDK